MKNENWFDLSTGQIEQKLKTNAAAGLSRKAARSRVNKTNGSVFVLAKESFWKLLGKTLSDFSVLLLLLASVIALFFEEHHTGVTVFVLLLCDIAVSFGISVLSVRTMERLTLCFYPKTKVIRSGRLFYVDGRTVVPGDVILIESGDILCCDARLINSSELAVQMRLDAEQYIELQKFAEGFVRPNEHRPQEMVNMVHAGSVVIKGSARAIVTATGRYTYLGARTGGIPIAVSKKFPTRLEKLYLKYSKYSLIGLLAVLPLCLLGLVISHNQGGTVLLSSAFLTLMSIVATGVSHLSFSASIGFYTHEIHRLTNEPSPAAVRSVETLEKLGQMRYVFVRDGAALCDGVKHFYSAYCDGWETKDLRSSASRFQKMGEIVALYHMAATETLTTGIGGAFQYDRAIRSFLSGIGTDRDALRIRCRIISYLPGDFHVDGEKVCVLDGTKKLWISVTSSPQILSKCTHLIGQTGKHDFSSDDRENMRIIVERVLESHQIPLIFTVLSENGADHEVGFVGMLVLKEGIDEKRMAHIRVLERMGCRVISFDTKGAEPALPFAISGERSVSKRELTDKKLPLWYRLGAFHRYTDFDDKDIADLIRFAHQNGDSVALLSFCECSEDLMELADLLISCAPIQRMDLSLLPQEIVSSEFSDSPTESNCTQAMRQKADVLLPRPVKGQGGLSSLIGMRGAAKRSGHSFLVFFHYLLCAQISRGVTFVLPLLFGKPMVDARHILFCSLILDSVAFLSFLLGKGASLKSMKSLIVSVLSSCVVMLGLPCVMDLSGMFGPYLYQTEYVFTAMIFLHLSILLCLVGKENQGVNIGTVCLIVGAGICLVVLTLCLLVPDIGSWLGMEKNPIPYLLASFIPGILFFLLSKLNFQRKRKM